MMLGSRRVVMSGKNRLFLHFSFACEEPSGRDFIICDEDGEPTTFEHVETIATTDLIEVAVVDVVAVGETLEGLYLVGVLQEFKSEEETSNYFIGLVVHWCSVLCLRANG